MRIAFYAPFKPLGHPRPSGDLAIGTGLYQFLQGRDHQLKIISKLRARWIYWKPWLWPKILRARSQALDRCNRLDASIWLTYHSYYKAPDLLGPECSRRLQLPYVIFQGIYSTKRRRDWRTWAGFVLNRHALLCADHVFSNRKIDLVNLERVVPRQKLSYVVPGIVPEQFSFDAATRQTMRLEWGVDKEVVVLTAAMFRAGVKSESLGWVIRSCAELYHKKYPFHLIVAGEGKEGPRLRQLADKWLPGRVRFLGKIAREEMYRFYSAGDLFVFPGIRESLGMVYLEAQACGLPVVAFADGGVPEVVAEGESGYLVRPYDNKGFIDAIARLLSNADLRKQMGDAAGRYVSRHHNLERNYRKVEEVLLKLVKGKDRDMQRIRGRTRYSVP
jgi:glycosyltransferase involved in cell wall biosynthesis